MRAFKYGFLSLLRNKGQMFWTLAFPLILGTFYSIAFSSIIQNTENFSRIPVAVVAETEVNNGQAEYFIEILDGLSQGDEALIAPVYTDMEEAKQLLNDGKVEGIYHITGDISLIMSNLGLNQSVLKSISDEFMQIYSSLGNLALTDPETIEQAFMDLMAESGINHEITLGRGETDTILQYYYALIAMTCLMGSFFGRLKVSAIQADQSTLAARRCVSPSRKISMILGDFSAAVALQFLEVLIVIAYLTLVLGINFGGQWGFVILAGLVGSITGVSYGIFIASVTRMGERAVDGFLTASTLILSFLSGLMVGGIKFLVEVYAPIVNRINPAALLSDAFYSLTVYDTYSRYSISIVTMLGISALFCICAAFVLRRKRYANI